MKQRMVIQVFPNTNLSKLTPEEKKIQRIQTYLHSLKSNELICYELEGLPPATEEELDEYVRECRVQGSMMSDKMIRIYGKTSLIQKKLREEAEEYLREQAKAELRSVVPDGQPRVVKRL